MRVADIKKNDIVDGVGVCVSLWVQGCPLHCKNCHNKSTWDFNGGTAINNDTLIEVLKLYLDKNNVNRNFSVLGGEPLSDLNVEDTLDILKSIKDYFSGTGRKIYLWTGYTIEEIRDKGGLQLECIKYVDYLIDGRYTDELKDVSLELRGSSNQRVLNKQLLENYYQ